VAARVNAELSARRAAARAALSDYRQQSDAHALDMMDRAVWAERLAGLLGPLLDEVDRLDAEGDGNQ
jgi:hypothetical protein